MLFKRNREQHIRITHHFDDRFVELLKSFFHSLNHKLEKIMATLDERFDALTERANKVLSEVQAVKQALADLRAAPGTLTPAQESKLAAAEDALSRIDEVNEDNTAP